MPSSATITTFYNFSPNTRARSSQVNVNFDAVRGHFLPIDPNTTTAGADGTWDLGATTHSWRTAYLQNIDFKSSTTTVSTIIESDTSLTSGGLKVKFDGTEVFRFTPLGFTGLSARSMDMTTSAARGQIALSPELGVLSADSISSFDNTTTPALAGGTITLETIGRPIFIGLINGGINGTDSSFSATMTALSPVYPATTVLRTFIYLDTSTNDVVRAVKQGVWVTSTSYLIPYFTIHTPNNYMIVQASAGTHNIWASFVRTASNGAFEHNARLTNVRLIAFELP